MLAVALVGFAILLGRVALLQTAEAASFREAGERQRVRSTTLPAARGAIFDRNGYELAISIPQTTIWADPRLIIDPAGTANALAPVLHFDPAQTNALARRLLRTSPSDQREFAYVARQVDDAVAEQVRALHLPGISDYPESRRFQPSDEPGVQHHRRDRSRRQGHLRAGAGLRQGADRHDRRAGARAGPGRAHDPGRTAPADPPDARATTSSSPWTATCST